MSDQTSRIAVYQRDVGAELCVRLEGGKEWPATDADLVKFGLLDRSTAVYAVTEAMEAMGLDPSDKHSALRYAIERAVGGNPLGAHDDDTDTIAELAAWAPLVPACDPDDRDAS